MAENIEAPSITKFINYTTLDGLASNVVNSVYGDNFGNVYVGTGVNSGTVNSGLSVLKAGQKKFIPYAVADGFVQNVPINCVYIDNYGSVYAGSSVITSVSLSGGLFILKKNDVKFANYTTAYGLWSNNIKSVYVDNSGYIYVGTYDLRTNTGGVSIGNSIYSSNIEFTTYTISDGLGSNIINSVYADNFGSVYVATGQDPYMKNSGGLSVLKKGEVKFTTYRIGNGLGSSNIKSVYVDISGTVYVGTLADGSPNSGGLSVLKKGDTRFTHYSTTDGLSSNEIYSVYVDDSSNIYAGTNQGLSVLKKGETKFKNYSTEDGLMGEVSSIYVDSTGHVYAGTPFGLAVMSAI